jgi:hypothetical protein
MRLLYLLASLCLLLVPASDAQRGTLIRGASLGIGLGIYQGELDKNSANNPVEFLASGNVGFTALVDGDLGPLVWEGGLNYQRIDIEVNEADFDVNVIGAEVTIGKDFRLLKRSRFLRVFAGIAPAFIGTSYNRTSTPDGCFFLDEDLYNEAAPLTGCEGGPRPFLNNREFVEQPSRFSFYVPVGIVLQDAVRISVRLFGTDYLDSLEREDTGPDWSPAVALMYRFRI